MKKKVLTSMSSKGYAPVGRNRKSSICENMVFAFVHLRILDVAKAMLLKNQRIQLNEMAFTVLSSSEISPPTAPEVLAMHKFETGDYREAAKHFIAAHFATISDWNSSLAFIVQAILCFEKADEDEPLTDEHILMEKQQTISLLFIGQLDMQSPFMQKYAVDNPDWLAITSAKKANRIGKLTVDSPVELLTMRVNSAVLAVFGLVFPPCTPELAVASQEYMYNLPRSTAVTEMVASPGFETCPAALSE